jgi:ubiquinone/menaquinone biosynthesis C-methylase UbiE
MFTSTYWNSMVSQTQLTGQDLFGRTFDMDEQSLAVMAARLESRGKHTFFSQVIDDYMNALALSRDETILDLGCGTGVVARTIARRGDVKGRIVAMDISPYLVGLGKRFASEEGVGGRIDFLTGDAHSIIEPEGKFDVVVMHTLVSHVVDPVTVIEEARRLLRPEGRIVIFDGDFASRVCATDAPDGGAEMDRLILRMTAQSTVMRQMPRLLAKGGFEMEWSRGYVAADIGRADFFSSILPAFRVLLPKAGVLREADANEFVDKLELASRNNEFFASCNFYTYIARRIARA